MYDEDEDMMPDEVPCIEGESHRWVCSDEDEEVYYCSNCGCCEY